MNAQKLWKLDICGDYVLPPFCVGESRANTRFLQTHTFSAGG